MSRWKTGLVLAVVTSSVVAGGPAVADGPGGGTVTGGDVSGPGSSATPAEQRQADAKLAFAEAYYAAKYEGGSAAELREAAAAYEAAYPRAGDPGIEEMATVPGSRAVVRRAQRSSLDVKGVTLALVHKGQLNSYYCGPASGKMMLDVLLDGPSKITGQMKNQPNLANASHMRTDINGKTGWDSSLFRIGLNKWRQGTPTGYYVDYDSPSFADFKRMLVGDIDNRHPLAADTVEFHDRRHYNNHPNRIDPIGHWIVAFGYRENGDVAEFADPATTQWPAATQTFLHDSKPFVNLYLQSNGIVW